MLKLPIVAIGHCYCRDFDETNASDLDLRCLYILTSKLNPNRGQSTNI
ncbi:hypothetical protein [Chamaesiphon sp. VAR_69_metabat_338]|nr:hypothetical protein [Chamaesiphon sp. VAR_69_metabat_338]